MNHRELLVGRRGEAPLVPPYIEIADSPASQSQATVD
jgi:hypothetical protein